MLEDPSAARAAQHEHWSFGGLSLDVCDSALRESLSVTQPVIDLHVDGVRVKQYVAEGRFYDPSR